MAINCCKDCVAPKRYPGCHGSCEQYIKEKAEYDHRKAEEDKRRKIEYGLDSHVGKRAYVLRQIRGRKG